MTRRVLIGVLSMAVLAAGAVFVRLQLFDQPAPAVVDPDARRARQSASDAGADLSVDATERAAVIDGALRHLQTAYVFPETATRMAETIRAHVDRGEYESIISSRALATLLTAHLQEVSHDKHLRVVYSSEPLLDRPPPPSAGPRNHGFERVERLDGGVGYIDVRAFNGSAESRPAAVAAMNAVADADALIIDLRQNGGGSPFMVGLIASYLFDGVVHLNDLYWREGDRTEQFFTSATVEGRRFGQKKPVFIVTSRRTFSAAEEFTYDLKTLKRATIVGETTGGGAHPGGMRRITDHFGIWVPSGRAINPITKTDWEGTGIDADIKVDAALALKTAHLEALRAIRSTTTDSRRREELDRLIGAAERTLGGSS